MAAIIQPFALRRDTAANWTTKNPVLLAGQEGYETDTRKRKVGDGTKTWTQLSYDAAESTGGGSFPVGGVIRLSYADGAYPVKAGPAGAEYEFVGPAHPGVLLDGNDTWIKTEA